MSILKGICLVTLALGISCGTPGGPVGPVIELQLGNDGLVYRKGDSFPYTGQHVMRDAQGNIQFVSNYEKGVRHGVMAVFYPDGSRRAECGVQQWPAGQRHHLESDGTEGSRAVDGSGTLIMYHPDGSKARESVYLNGVRQSRTNFPPAGGSTNAQKNRPARTGRWVIQWLFSTAPSSSFYRRPCSCGRAPWCVHAGAGSSRAGQASS